jgi:LacI family transcriptional regulator
VPRDVSICGFDDSWVAKSVWPYLTTIAQPTEAMAYRAAMQLLKRPQAAAGQRLEQLGYTLIERESVGPAP